MSTTTISSELARKLLVRVWLFEQRRSLQTSLPRMDTSLQPRVFREIRDVGYAPRFKDERFKKGIQLPRFDRRDWYKHSHLAGMVGVMVAFYHAFKEEWRAEAEDMKLLRNSQFIEDDEAVVEKYMKMFEENIEQVWKKNNVG